MNEVEYNKKCPFCGKDKIKVEFKSKLVGHNGLDYNVYQISMSVRCNCCHARGPVVSGKVIPTMDDRLYDMPKWATTRSQLELKAFKLWNNRK